MAEAKIVINYEQIIRALGAELQDVYFALSALDPTVEDNKAIINQIQNIKAIEIADEQNFVRKDREKRLLKGTLYVVVKFSPGATNFGSSVSPISLMCVGTANQVKPTQILLGVFASTWTAKNLCQEMVDNEGNDIEISDALQVWNTPEVITNFNEVDADFKNLFRLTGNIVVGQSAVRVGKLTYYWNEAVNGQIVEKSEVVNVMSFKDGYHASLDSQPFGNTNGFAQSEVNFSTYTFTISTYLLTGKLAADMLAIRGFRYRPGGTYNASTSRFDANDKVKVKIEFSNGYNNTPGSGESASAADPVKGDNFYMFYKVVDSQIGQELAGIPSLVVAFAR